VANGIDKAFMEQLKSKTDIAIDDIRSVIISFAKQIAFHNPGNKNKRKG